MHDAESTLDIDMGSDHTAVRSTLDVRKQTTEISRSAGVRARRIQWSQACPEQYVENLQVLLEEAQLCIDEDKRCSQINGLLAGTAWKSMRPGNPETSSPRCKTNP